MAIILKYVGDGSFLPGIPDRDLSEEDVEATGMKVSELVSTGLYVKVEKKMENNKPSNKANLKGYENKEKKL